MTTALQVTCINKPDRENWHTRILNIGGVNDGFGRQRTITEQDAIAYIKNKTYTFYVDVNGYRVDVIIGIREGREYLKTKPDATGRDNLLSLGECRVPVR